MCQRQHKTLRLHIEFIQLKPKNLLKQVHYLVKHEDVLPQQKNVSHRFLGDYGDDQITLRIQDKSNSVTYTPLNSVCFNLYHQF